MDCHVALRAPRNDIIALSLRAQQSNPFYKSSYKQCTGSKTNFNTSNGIENMAHNTPIINLVTKLYFTKNFKSRLVILIPCFLRKCRTIPIAVQPFELQILQYIGLNMSLIESHNVASNITFTSLSYTHIILQNNENVK